MIGMTASSLAASGFLGVIFFPFLLVFPVLFLGNLIFFDLKSGPLGYFIVVFSWIIAELSFDSFLVYSFRNVVIAYVFFVALAFYMHGRMVTRVRSISSMMNVST